MKTLFALLVTSVMFSTMAAGCAHKAKKPAAVAPTVQPAPVERALTPPPAQ